MLNDHVKDEKFQRGLEQFNSGQFFEAHETWEEIWLAAQEPERTFLQGIIQVSAALHHFTRGNRAGAQSLLEAGLNKLDRFPATFRGIQLDELRAAGKRWVAELAAGRSPGNEQFPHIRPAPKS